MKIADLFVDLKLDTTSFERDLKTALTRAQSVARDIKINVDVDTSGVAGKVAKASGTTGKANIGVDVDTSAVSKKIAQAAKSSGTAVINVDADTRAASTKIDLAARNRESHIDVKVTGEKGIALAYRGVSNLTTAIAAIGPTAIPVLATVTAGVGILGSALIGAGGAGAVFGASVAGQIKAMQAAQQAIGTTQKALAKLTPGTKEYSAKLAELKQQQTDFNATFGPAAAGFNNLKGAWQGFLDATSKTTLGAMASGLNFVAGLLPRLVPLSNAAGGAVKGLIADFAKFSKSAQFQGILDFFQKQGPPAITAFGHIIGNIMLGIFNLFKSFAPVQQGFLAKFEQMTAAFATWSAGFASSDGFTRFMAYARENLPLVRDLFLSLTEFVGKFVVALGPLAALQLQGMTMLTKALNKLPPPVLTAIAGAMALVVVSLKAWEIAAKSAAIFNALFVTSVNATTGAVNLSGIARARATVITVASAVAERAAAVSAKALAAAQWLVNAALRANPIGIVITVLVALGAALVLAYKHSETFRAIVNRAWASIKGAVQNAWGAIRPVLSAFSRFLTGTLIPVITRFFSGVVKPVFASIGATISAVWNNVVKPVFAAYKAYLTNVLFPVIRFLWKNVVVPVFKGVGNAVSGAWNGVIKPIFTAWRAYFNNVLFPVIRFLWKNVVVPVFNGIKATISNVWNNGIKPIFAALKNTVQKIPDAFKAARDAVGKIWIGLERLAAKPVKFIVDTVYMGGIYKVVGALPGKNPLPALSFNPKFAQGGVLPGYTPGQDVHHFSSPTGGQLHLSGGEAIMRPEWTKAVGGEPAVQQMNKLAKKGILERYLAGPDERRAVSGFAGGGVYRPTAGGSYGGVHDAYTGYPAVDVRVGTGTPVHAAASGRVSISKDLRGNQANGYRSYGRYIVIDHGAWSSLYAHLKSRGVGVGASVAGGSVIAPSDNTGNSSGPHLHFGVKGKSVTQVMQGSTNYAGKGTASGGSTGGSSGGGGTVATPWTIPNPLRFMKISDWKSKLSGMGGWGDIMTDTVGSMGSTVTGYVKDKIASIYSSVKNIGGWLSDKLTGTEYTSNAGSLISGTIGSLAGAAQGKLSPGAARIVGHKGMPKGWSWPALLSLWNRESGWRWNADNPTSSAYGIPQALPGSKMRSAGADWKTNALTQIKWGFGYIRGRYGNSQAAWAHSQARGWYGDGGVIPGQGSPTGDSILARVSPGEYVMPAKQTAMFGDELESMRRSLPGYAKGGLIPHSAIPKKNAAHTAGSLRKIGFHDDKKKKSWVPSTTDVGKGIPASAVAAPLEAILRKNTWTLYSGRLYVTGSAALKTAQKIAAAKVQSSTDAKTAATNKAAYLSQKIVDAFSERESAGDLTAYDQQIAMLKRQQGSLKAWSDAWVEIQHQIDELSKAKSSAVKEIAAAAAEEAAHIAQNKLDFEFNKFFATLDISDQIKALQGKLVGLKQYSDEWVSLMNQIADMQKQMADAAADAAKAIADARSEIASNLRGDFFHEGFTQQFVAGADFRGLLSGLLDQVKALKELGGISQITYDSLADYARRYALSLEDVQKNLDANAIAQDAANTALDESKSKLGAAQDAWDSLKDSVKGSVTALASFADSSAGQAFADAQKTYDATLAKYGPDSGNTAEARRQLDAAQISPSNIVSDLRIKLDQIRSFAANIQGLRTMGLGAAAIQQIIALGPIDGAPYAEALLKALPNDISALNSLQSDYDAFGDAFGSTMANAFASANITNAQLGVNAAQGILDGLKSQEQSLLDYMRSLANKITAVFEQQLGIASPSRVFKQVGINTLLGLQEGLVSQVPNTLGKLNDLADSMALISAQDAGNQARSQALSQAAQTPAPPARGNGPAVQIGTIQVQDNVTAQVLVQRLNFWANQNGRTR